MVDFFELSLVFYLGWLPTSALQLAANYFEDIKKAKKYRYVVFYIKEEKSIVVESVGDRDSSYDDYLNDLQKGGDGECRYGLYDYEYEHQCQGTTESSKKQKLFLMAWCPDSAKIKKKMLYSSSFDALKKSLVGVHKFIQVKHFYQDFTQI
jgi:cofilin